MSRQPGQVMRFTDQEIGLIKILFADNEDLLFTIRKVLLQFPLTEAEEVSLKNVMNDQVYSLLRKTFIPELSGDTPLLGLSDLFVGLTNDIKTKNVEEMRPVFLARELMIEYFEQQIKLLNDTSVIPSNFISLKAMANIVGDADEDKYVKISCRNFILMYVDSNLVQLKSFAGQKDETVEEVKKRLERNSSK